MRKIYNVSINGTSYQVEVEELNEVPVQQSAPAQPVQQAAPAEDPYDMLLKMKQLLDAGVLTQEEFDQAKAKLLGV